MRLAAIFAFACLASLAAAQLPATLYDSVSAQSQGSFRRALPFRAALRGGFRRQAPTGNPADDLAANGGSADLGQQQEQAPYGNGYANVNGGNGGASADLAEVPIEGETPLEEGAPEDVSTDGVATDPENPITDTNLELAGDAGDAAGGSDESTGNDADDLGDGGSDLDGLRTNIRGEPGVDYPILAEVPNTDFKCSDRERPGYYGDPSEASRCQVFHICQADDRMDSFLCPNGTIFSQKNFVCVWWWQYDCAQTEKDWALNENLYIENGQGGGSDELVDQPPAVDDTGAPTDDALAPIDEVAPGEEGSTGGDDANADLGDGAAPGGDGGSGIGSYGPGGDGNGGSNNGNGLLGPEDQQGPAAPPPTLDSTSGTKGGSSQQPSPDEQQQKSDLSDPNSDIPVSPVDETIDGGDAPVDGPSADVTADGGSAEQQQQTDDGSAALTAEELPAPDAVVDDSAANTDEPSADLSAGAYKNGYATANGYSRNGNGASVAKAAGRFSSLRFSIRGSRSRSALRSRSRSRSRSRGSLRSRSRGSLRFRSRSRSASRRGLRRRRPSTRRSRSRSASRRRSSRRRSSSRSSRRRSFRRGGRRASFGRRRRFRARFASRRSFRRARN